MLIPTRATVFTVTTLTRNSTPGAELLTTRVEASGPAWLVEACWDIFLGVRGQHRDEWRLEYVTETCCGKTCFMQDCGSLVSYACVAVVSPVATATTVTVTAEHIPLGDPPLPLEHGLLQVCEHSTL